MNQEMGKYVPDLESKLRFAVNIDSNYKEQIRKLMLMRNEVPKHQSQMMPDALGRDIVLLFEGLKYPVNLIPLIGKVIDAQHEMGFWYMMLEDKDLPSDVDLTGYQNGLLMHCAPNSTRTAVIKKWARKEAYAMNPRGEGFKSAVANINEFTTSNIELQYVLERKFGIEPYDRVLAFQNKGIADWESVWKRYNKLFYGSDKLSLLPAKVIEEAKTIGLDNKSLFEQNLKYGENLHAAFKAFTLIERLVRV